MMNSAVVTCTVTREAKALYEQVWHPERFAAWASGLSQARLQAQADGTWTGQGPEGPIRVRFTDHNPHGVMDHWVDIGGDTIFYIPLRIIANGTGSEVMLTLFQYPGMTDERFAADRDWVMRDLLALKALGEAAG